MQKDPGLMQETPMAPLVLDRSLNLPQRFQCPDFYRYPDQIK